MHDHIEVAPRSAFSMIQRQWQNQLFCSEIFERNQRILRCSQSKSEGENLEAGTGKPDLKQLSSSSASCHRALPLLVLSKIPVRVWVGLSWGWQTYCQYWACDDNGQDLRSVASAAQIPSAHGEVFPQMSYMLQPAWCWGHANFWCVFHFWGVPWKQTKCLLRALHRRKGTGAASGTNHLCFTAHWWAASESCSSSCRPLHKTCSRWLAAAGGLKPLLLAQRGGGFWLSWEDRLPVRVPPQPSDVVARRWSVQRHREQSHPAVGWGYSTNRLSLLCCLATIWQTLTVSTQSQPSSLESQLCWQGSPSHGDVTEQLLELIEELVGLTWRGLKSSGGLCWMWGYRHPFMWELYLSVPRLHVRRWSSFWLFLSWNEFFLLFTYMSLFLFLWALLHPHKY